MNFSLFFPPASCTSYHQAIDLCLELGLTGLELFPMLELESGDLEAAKAIGEAARAKGLALPCLSVATDLAAQDGADRVALLKHWADCAAALGIPYLHHTLALQLEPGYGPVTYRQLRDRVIPQAREICDYAADRGVTILYEDQGLYINGATRFGDFLGCLDRPAGICLDVGNCMFVDELAHDFLPQFLPFVRHVHVKDYLRRDAKMPHPGPGWYTTARGDRLLEVPMGYGHVEFERIFAMLLGYGYDGWYSAEYCGQGDRAALELSVRNVRRYYENAQRAAALDTPSTLRSV